MSKKQISVRISDEGDTLLKKLAEKRQTSQANIIDEAIRDMAKKEGVLI